MPTACRQPPLTAFECSGFPTVLDGASWASGYVLTRFLFSAVDATTSEKCVVHYTACIIHTFPAEASRFKTLGDIKNPPSRPLPPFHLTSLTVSASPVQTPVHTPSPSSRAFGTDGKTRFSSHRRPPVSDTLSCRSNVAFSQPLLFRRAGLFWELRSADPGDSGETTKSEGSIFTHINILQLPTYN